MSLELQSAHLLARPPRIVTAETRKKISDSQVGTKNHNYGKKFSIETKAKMSDSMMCNTRYDFDGVTILPRRMKFIRGSGAIGYSIVSHSSLRNRRVDFTCMQHIFDRDKGTLDEVRAKCMFYLDHLDECASNRISPIPKLVFMKGFRSVTSSL